MPQSGISLDSASLSHCSYHGLETVSQIYYCRLERGDWYYFALNLVPVLVIGMYIWAGMIFARVERRGQAGGVQ